MNMSESDNWSARVDLLDTNKRTLVTSKKSMSVLQKLYDASIQDALVNKLGLGWAIAINGNNNKITFNINGGKQKQETARAVKSDNKMADILLEIHPEFGTRFVYVPKDPRESGIQGIWYCDEETNVWRMESNAFFDKYILDRFTEFYKKCAAAKIEAARLISNGLKEEEAWKRLGPGPEFDPTKQLTDTEMYGLESVRGCSDIRVVLSKRLLRRKFESSLDKNFDLFPCENGAFVTNEPGVPFRPIRIEDMVSITAEWEYKPEEASERRAEVERFLEQVLPVPEERALTLTYIASLLSGWRKNKRFAVFTDKRKGDNGKSMFADLCLEFFDGMASKDGTKLVTRPAVDLGNRNSHDAGTLNCKNLRLLIAEEMGPHMIMDTSFLKRVVSPMETMSGRGCNEGHNFKFTWTAGVVLVFNEGRIPKTDLTDEAFCARIFVVPFRSKFVSADRLDNDDEAEEWTFAMDQGLKQKFPTWLSAFADILREHFDPTNEKLLNVPASMMTWKADLMSDDVSAWLDKVITITGDEKGDRVHFGDALRDKMLSALKRTHVAVSAIQACSPEDFKNRLSKFVSDNAHRGCKWKDRTKQTGVEGHPADVSVACRNAAWGVRVNMEMLEG